MTLVCATQSGAYAVCEEVELTQPITTLAGLDVDGDGRDDLVFVGDDAPTTLHVLLAKP